MAAYSWGSTAGASGGGGSVVGLGTPISAQINPMQPFTVPTGKILLGHLLAIGQSTGVIVNGQPLVSTLDSNFSIPVSLGSEDVVTVGALIGINGMLYDA